MDDISETPSTKLAVNKDDANTGPAASAAIPGGETQTPAPGSSPGLAGDHNRETGEKSTGNGDLQADHSQEPTGGDEGLTDAGSREGGEEEDSDLDDEESDDDNEVEYDDEDMFFEEHFDPSPAELHRKNSMREPMVPYGCIDPEQALQHFVQVFEERYGKKHPHFYIGSLENAMEEVTKGMEDPDELKPLLIFIHNDHSILAHVFCGQVLCNQTVIDFLNTNYITWPWDITQPENKETLLSLVEDCFSKEPQDDNEGKEDKSIQVIRPWFKQPQQPQPRLWEHQRQLAEHVPPKAVLQQLIAGKDDLPACMIFYPISNQPDSIQGTWITSKSTGDMTESFLSFLVSSVENYKVLLQQSQHLIEDSLQEPNRRAYVHHQAPPIGPSYQVPPLGPSLLPVGPFPQPRPLIDLSFLQNILGFYGQETSVDPPEEEDSRPQVEQEQAETWANPSESHTEETQGQEMPESDQFHLNKDSSDE